MTDSLVERAERWVAHDPDPETSRALEEVLAAGDEARLAALVDGTLSFGTAGLRAEVGPGPRRMNRAVVIRATRGLVDHLRRAWHPERGVVVGFDARPDSRRFARDVVGVVAAAGVPVRWFDRPVPTPLVAYAARSRRAAAAVVVTASHNPPGDNGYKVYGPGGLQITPPTDERIAAAIEAAPPADEVPRVQEPGQADLLATLGEEVVVDYLDDIAAARPDPGPADRDLPIVYTALHGVGGALTCRALAAAGFSDVTPVAAQQEPDGTFPTVGFPNPEEPGALELALRTAEEAGAGLVLANDPDADRLAVAVPRGGAERPGLSGEPDAVPRGGAERRAPPGASDPATPGEQDDGWHQLTGNQVGLLLADHLLEATDVDRPLVVSSIVSSPALGAVADRHGARWETTLTGFKWICRAAESLRGDGHRLVLGYEEALGYTVGEVVADKDGIAAAVVFAGLAASLRARGRTVRDALDDLARRDGLWVSHQHSLRREGPQGAAAIGAAMERAGGERPDELAGRSVARVRDLRQGADDRPPWLPATPLVVYELASGRALVRPSGTEPKLKIYVDLRAGDVAGAGTDGLRRREAALRGEARAAARDLAGVLGMG